MATRSHMTHSYRICPNCNNVSFAKDDQRFCIWCGIKLVEQCARCSKPMLYAHSKFCYNCGAQYTEAHMLSGSGEGVRAKEVVGVESWAKERTRRFEVKFSTKDFLARRKP